MRKTGAVVLTILLILLFCRPARVQAIDRFEDLLPTVDPDSSLSPVQNLRFQMYDSEVGDRRLRIFWDKVEGADAYYVLYSFLLNGIAYPNSKLLEAEQLHYDPTVLGCGIHSFRVYPLYQNRTCDSVSNIDIFVADNTFFPSMLEDGQSVDYYTSAAIEQGLERFQEIAAGNHLSEKNDLQKLRTIHNAMCEAIEYSTEESDAYQAILSGEGLCDVYARGFKILCDLSGVPCEYVVGWAGDDGVEYESHAWNLVALDGAYYHVDTTWNDLEGSFRYFLLSDKEIEKNHTIETEILPTADSDRFKIDMGRFATKSLHLKVGEARTVGLDIQPQEAAFRAGISLSNPAIAVCTITGNSLSISARHAGVTSLQITDGETGFGKLWIEVTAEEKPNTALVGKPNGEGGALLWYLFWGIVFLGSCVGMYLFTKSRKRD